MPRKEASTGSSRSTQAAWARDVWEFTMNRSKGLHLGRRHQALAGYRSQAPAVN